MWPLIFRGSVLASAKAAQNHPWDQSSAEPLDRISFIENSAKRAPRRRYSSRNDSCKWQSLASAHRVGPDVSATLGIHFRPIAATLCVQWSPDQLPRPPIPIGSASRREIDSSPVTDFARNSSLNTREQADPSGRVADFLLQIAETVHSSWCFYLGDRFDWFVTDCVLRRGTVFCVYVGSEVL